VTCETGETTPHVHLDESPWPVLGLKEWMWVAANSEFCLFHAGTPARAELVSQLGTVLRVISSDDFSAYNGYPVTAQQKLAHLRRHFQKVEVRSWQRYRLGASLLDLISVCPASAMARNQDSAYATWASGFKLRLNQSIQKWISRAGYEGGKLLRSLRDKTEQWLYFLDHPEVPPDNNQAERLSCDQAQGQWGLLDGSVCRDGRLVESCRS